MQNGFYDTVQLNMIVCLPAVSYFCEAIFLAKFKASGF